MMSVISIIMSLVSGHELQARNYSIKDSDTTESNTEGVSRLEESRSMPPPLPPRENFGFLRNMYAISSILKSIPTRN